MFVIDKINIDLFNNIDIGFIPIYRGVNFEIVSMWSGLWFINYENIKHSIDFGLGLVQGINTDVMGKTYHLLKHNYIKEYWQFYNLYKKEKNKLETVYNGCCKIDFDENMTICSPHISKTKLFPYDIDTTDLEAQQREHYAYIMNIMEQYKFPQPYNIDFMKFQNGFKIIHFKSSNWCPWYYDEYVSLKKSAIINFLNL